MKLTKTFGQENKDGSVTTFNIDVDYLPVTNTVLEILYVTVYDAARNIWIDVTGIFAGELNDQLEDMVDKCDWREVYREQRKAA